MAPLGGGGGVRLAPEGGQGKDRSGTTERGRS